MNIKSEKNMIDQIKKENWKEITKVIEFLVSFDKYVFFGYFVFLHLSLSFLLFKSSSLSEQS